MAIRELADLTWEEVRDADRARTVAVLPVGALEAHGPHLPLATDVLIAVDVSFISLAAIIPALVEVCKPGAAMVLLVKPQFEAGRAEVSRGRGVITDPAVHDRVRSEVDAALVGPGCRIEGWMDSPILGGEGNKEFLVHAVAPERAVG